MKKDIVKITCYGREETMERREAINFYLEGMMSCEGAEQERYTNIYTQLVAGLKVVSDQKDNLVAPAKATGKPSKGGVKVTGFNFREKDGRRELVISLDNGNAWIIKANYKQGEGFPVVFDGKEDRRATNEETKALQVVADAFNGFLRGEKRGYGISYGELTYIDEFAEVFDWDGAGLPEPTEEEGGPSLILTEWIVNFISI